MGKKKLVLKRERTSKILLDCSLTLCFSLSCK